MSTTGRDRRPGVAVLVALTAILAACGGGDEEEAPPAAPVVPAADVPVPQAPALPAGEVVHGALIGQWAPSAAQCQAGARLEIGATLLTNTRSDQTTCTILSSERDEGVITVVGTCTPTPGVLENVTFAIAAEVVGTAQATALELIQGGLQNGEPFEQQLHLVRCTGQAP